MTRDTVTCMRARFALAAAAAGLPLSPAAAGCSDGGVGDGVEPDAFICFSGGMPQGAEERGSIVLGEGDEAFEPIAEDQELTLHPGIAGAPYFEVQVRIEGLVPGDDSGTRPRTLLRVWDEQGEQVSVRDCDQRMPYEETDDGAAIMSSPAIVVVFPNMREEIDGERVRIEAEILDPEGGYARDEVWVVADYEPFDG